MASILSKIGSGLRRAAPEMIRGALVAAANPTRGAVGTAGDIFGAIGAVEDDRMARMQRQRQMEMQAIEMRRKAEDDAREAALNEAKIAESKARAEYQQRRGTPQAGKGVPPTKLQMYKEAFDHYKSQGFSDEDAHVEARSIALGTPSPELYNKRTASSDAGQMNRELENWRKNPALQEQYPKFEDYYKSIGIGASKADTAGQVTTAKKKAEIPFLIRRPIAGDKEYYSQDVALNPQGTGVDVKFNPTGVKTRQPSGGNTPRPRYRLETDKDGVQWRINVDNPSDKVKTGIEKKVGGGPSDDWKKQIAERILGGTATPQKKADPLGVR